MKILIKVLVLLLSFSVVQATQVAAAAQIVISTTTSIENGSQDPIVYLTGTNFSQEVTKFDIEANLGTTSLSYISVAFINSEKVRVNLSGSAKAGVITFQALKTAFTTASDTDVKPVQITVAEAILFETIYVADLKDMFLTDKDQALSITTTSGTPVEVTSQTIGICSIIAEKIHPVANGYCSVRVSLAQTATYAKADDVVKVIKISKEELPVIAPPVKATPSVSLGMLNYNPVNTEDTTASFYLVNDKILASPVHIVLKVAPGTTSTAAVFMLSVVTTPEQALQGDFAVRIVAVDLFGKTIPTLNKSVEILLPAVKNNSILGYSIDNSIWVKIKKSQATVDESEPVYTQEVNLYTVTSKQMGTLATWPESVYKAKQNPSEATSVKPEPKPETVKPLKGVEAIWYEMSKDLISISLGAEFAAKTAVLETRVKGKNKRYVYKEISSISLNDTGAAIFTLSGSLNKNNYFRVTVDNKTQIVDVFKF